MCVVYICYVLTNYNYTQIERLASPPLYMHIHILMDKWKGINTPFIYTLCTYIHLNYIYILIYTYIHLYNITAFACTHTHTHARTQARTHTHTENAYIQ